MPWLYCALASLNAQSRFLIMGFGGGGHHITPIVSCFLQCFSPGRSVCPSSSSSLPNFFIWHHPPPASYWGRLTITPGIKPIREGAFYNEPRPTLPVRWLCVCPTEIPHLWFWSLKLKLLFMSASLHSCPEQSLPASCSSDLTDTAFSGLPLPRAHVKPSKLFSWTAPPPWNMKEEEKCHCSPTTHFTEILLLHLFYICPVIGLKFRKSVFRKPLCKNGTNLASHFGMQEEILATYLCFSSAFWGHSWNWDRKKSHFNILVYMGFFFFFPIPITP